MWAKIWFVGLKCVSTDIQCLPAALSSHLWINCAGPLCQSLCGSPHHLHLPLSLSHPFVCLSVPGLTSWSQRSPVMVTSPDSAASRSIDAPSLQDFSGSGCSLPIFQPSSHLFFYPPITLIPLALHPPSITPPLQPQAGSGAQSAFTVLNTEVLPSGQGSYFTVGCTWDGYRALLWNIRASPKWKMYLKVWIWRRSSMFYLLHLPLSSYSHFKGVAFGSHLQLRNVDQIEQREVKRAWDEFFCLKATEHFGENKSMFEEGAW